MNRGRACVWFLAAGLLLLVTGGPAIADAGGDAAAQALQEAHAGRLERAVTLYGAALDAGDLSDTERAVVHNNRGFARLQLGDRTGALADYDRAIELDPGYVGAYDNRGWLHRLDDEPDLALDDFDRAIRLDPGYLNAVNNRGLILLDLARYDEAIADFDRIIRRGGLGEGREAWPHNNRGFAFARKGDITRAVAAYTRAIQADPDYPDSYVNRGDAYALLKNWKKAVRDYTDAIRLDPDHPAAYGHRGSVQERRGRYDAAAQDYARQLEVTPEAEDWLAPRIATIQASIRDLQTELNVAGYDVGDPDGLAGDRTREAIAAFRESIGEEPTDRIDEAVIEQLRAINEGVETKVKLPNKLPR